MIIRFRYAPCIIICLLFLSSMSIGASISPQGKSTDIQYQTRLSPRQTPPKPDYISIDGSANIAYVVVKLSEGIRPRLSGHRLISLNGKNLDPINSILTTKNINSIRPLISKAPKELEKGKFLLEQKAGQVLADFNGYFTIAVSSATEAENLVNQLNRLPEVEIAYPRPQSVLAVDIDPPTPTYADSQIYLNPAPEGIDAVYGNSVIGGDGTGVKIVDIEGSWKLEHEDLELSEDVVLGGDINLNIDWRNHGTAVIGTLIGKNNGYGITGIVPGAEIGLVSHNGQSSDAAAIMNAVDSLETGDVILIELQTPGPRYGFQYRTDQLGYVCLEYFQAEFDAIQYAWAKGIIVVEAAGNGAENFDDAIYENRFDTTFRNSHAIIVGAGAPPSGNYGTDRKVLEFSNYGQRVNLQGYGREIVTCGYGDLFTGNGDERQYYTKQFGGTSGAVPIVAGAAVSLQGIYKNRYSGTSLDADRMRNVLVATGSPQQGFPTYHIGPRPDIKSADTALPEPYNLTVEPIYLDTTMTQGEILSTPLVLKNSSPTQTLEYQVTIPDSLIKTGQSSWLSLSNYSGTIAPVDSVTLSLTLDASAIDDRTQIYKGILQISFASQGASLDNSISFPVFLTVPCNDTTYTVSASFQSGNIEFDWIDLTTVGLEIPYYSWYNDAVSEDTLDDGTAGPYPFGFDFPFYDTTYTSVYIGVNGAVSFTDHDVNITGKFTNIDIPNPPFSTLVAPFWNDLNIELDDGHGSVYFYRMPHHEGFVIQYNQVGRYGAPNDTLTTFQIILYRNGNIKFQYLSVGNSDLADSAVIAIADYDCKSLPFVIRSLPAENVVSDSSVVLFDYAYIIWEMSGDANYDDNVNVGDAVYLINYVFKAGPAPPKMIEADANCDGEANVGDAVYIINYVFKSGPEPCSYEL